MNEARTFSNPMRTTPKSDHPRNAPTGRREHPGAHAHLLCPPASTTVAGGYSYFMSATFYFEDDFR